MLGTTVMWRPQALRVCFEKQFGIKIFCIDKCVFKLCSLSLNYNHTAGAGTVKYNAHLTQPHMPLITLSSSTSS